MTKEEKSRLNREAWRKLSQVQKLQWQQNKPGAAPVTDKNEEAGRLYMMGHSVYSIAEALSMHPVKVRHAVRRYSRYADVTAAMAVFVKKYFAMLNRCYQNHLEQDADFTPDLNGFIRFLMVMGPVPEDMKQPSVGRRTHRRGYVKKNMAWQEWTRNKAIGDLT